MKRFSGLWPLAVLALMLAMVFGPAIAQGVLLAPNDGLAQYFPERVVIAESLRRGELPFWNPYIFGGMPLLAAMQGGVLYPGNLAFLLLPPVAAMNATVLLAYVVAGAGAYAFGRTLAMLRPAALLTGVSYMLGGFFMGHLEHVVMIQAAGLLPWLLWAIEKARATGRASYAQVGALILAFMLLAGHPQTAAFSLAVAAAYGAWRLAGPEAGRRPFAVSLALMAVLGVGLALMQLLPTWELSRLSDRQALAYPALIELSLPPRQLLTLLFPFLFGGVPSTLFPTSYWGAGAWPNELMGYMGLGTTMLAAAAVIGRWRDGAVRFFVVLGLAGVLLALGGFTPLYQLWAKVPVLNSMRVPGRHFLEVHLALSVLGGLGMARLLAADASGRARLALAAWAALAVPMLGVAGGVAVVGDALAARWQAFAPVDLAHALAWSQPGLWLPIAGLAALGLAICLRRRPALWAAAMIGLVACDLGLFARHAGWREHSPVVAAVPAAPGFADHRTASLAASAYPYRDLAAVQALRYPVTGALWGVMSVGGYDPLMPARFARLMGEVAHGGHLTLPAIFAPEHHGLDLLGARQLVLEAPLREAWKKHLPARRFRPLASEGTVDLYENTRALPLAWRPAIAEVLPPEEVDALVTRSADFDPRTTVLLEAPMAIARVAPGLASVDRRSLNRLEVATSGNGPGVVVVSESYDPGWRAFLRGVELPVHRANGLLLGVEVPAGAHQLELRYEPRLWRAGLTGSLLALLGLIAWWWRPLRRGMSSKEGRPA